MKTAFSCTLNAITWARVDYMKYSIHQPLPPLFNFFHSNQWRAWGFVPHSYASDSGVARIYQQGGQSDQAGEGVGGGWRFFGKFVYENCIFLHMKCHYQGDRIL